MSEVPKPEQKLVHHSDGWTTLGINIDHYNENELRQALAKAELEEKEDDRKTKEIRP